jgi:hypothetical protein
VPQALTAQPQQRSQPSAAQAAHGSRGITTQPGVTARVFRL